MKRIVCLLGKVKQYLPAVLAILVLTTGVLVSAVYGKYVKDIQGNKINLDVVVFGNIELQLREGSTINIEEKDNAQIVQWNASEHQPYGAKLIPGAKLTYNPYVWVGKDSTACYVFIKIEESENFSTYLNYSVLTGEGEWEQGTGEVIPKNVFYREVQALNPSAVNAEGIPNGQEFQIIANNTISIPWNVTEAMLTSIASDPPKLTITAYAIQQSDSTDANAPNSAENAWRLIDEWIKKPPTP